MGLKLFLPSAIRDRLSSLTNYIKSHSQKGGRDEGKTMSGESFRAVVEGDYICQSADESHSMRPAYAKRFLFSFHLSFYRAQQEKRFFFLY